MRRRSGAGGEPIKTRRRKATTLKRGSGPKDARRRGSAAAGLHKKVALLTRERDEALEQQTATSEVLSIIRRSPADAQPVFDAIVQSAARLCGAIFSAVYLYEDDHVHIAATNNFSPEAARRAVELREQKRPDRSHLGGRAILDRAIVHVPDVLNDPEYSREWALAGGWRAVLAVPLLRDGKPVGAVTVAKAEPKPFSDRQVQLLNSFADQALIAIENARLFEAEQQRSRELTESLQQQTGTADVLKAISRSTFDLPTVLSTLVESAARLCRADMAQILLPTKDVHSFYSAASYGHTPEYNEYLSTLTFAPGREGVVGRVLLEHRPVQIADVLADPDYRLREVQRLGGFRTHLGLPLLREGKPIGILIVSRATVQPFDDKHIALLTTFADQAVVAIENTRLFEAEQQRTPRTLRVAGTADRHIGGAASHRQARRAIFSRYSRPCSTMLCASATQSLEISFVGKATPSTSSRRTIYRLPSPSFAGAHRLVPVRKIPSVAWWRRKRLFRSPILLRSSVTSTDVIQQLLLPSNLGAYGRLWLSRC